MGSVVEDRIEAAAAPPAAAQGADLAGRIPARTALHAGAETGCGQARARGVRSGCCMPRGETATAPPPAESARSEDPALALVAIPGGIAQVGTDRPMIPADGEGPMRAVLLSPFHIAATAVSNADFARFVTATGYRTTAERQGAGFVFHAHVAAPEAAHTPASPSWWRRVEGACWNRPFGPDSSLSGREDHPVVQVSRHDAEAFRGRMGTRSARRPAGPDLSLGRPRPGRRVPALQHLAGRLPPP